jgi:hypothetical protein
VRRLQRLGHWLASWSRSWWIREAGLSAGKVEVLHASCWDYFIHAGCKRHITPQGAGVATGPVKFVVGALRRLVWTWKTGGRSDRMHIRVHLWWVSRWTRRLLVMTGARCPLTKPVVAAVELQATTEPHCSRGVQPAAVFAHIWHIAGRLLEVRGRACAQAAGASYASCRSDSVYIPLWFYSYSRRSLSGLGGGAARTV